MQGSIANCSVVNKNGEYTLKFRYDNKDGVDIDYSAQGENIVDLFNEALEDIVEDYKTQTAALLEQEEEEEEIEEEVEEKDEYTLQLEKIIKDLTAENNSLKTDLSILQKRADDAVNKKANTNPYRYSKRYTIDPNRLLKHLLNEIYY